MKSEEEIASSKQYIVEKFCITRRLDRKSKLLRMIFINILPFDHGKSGFKESERKKL